MDEFMRQQEIEIRRSEFSKGLMGKPLNLWEHKEGEKGKILAKALQAMAVVKSGFTFARI